MSQLNNNANISPPETGARSRNVNGHTLFKMNYDHNLSKNLSASERLATCKLSKIRAESTRNIP